MGITRRKAQPLTRPAPTRAPEKLFVIATEDTYAAKQYFEMFGSHKILVVVLETTEGHSSPDHVLLRLNEYYEKINITAYDQYWVVIDTDRWPVKTLSSLATTVRHKGYYLAASNPCFDLWILLHFTSQLPQDIVPGCKYKEVHKALVDILGGYDKKLTDTSLFTKDNIRSAIALARKLDVNPKDAWPQKPGTRVYLIIEEIQKIADFFSHVGVAHLSDPATRRTE